jgi:hypothetical protein
MQATFGIPNQLLRTIHGGICQIKQWPHIIPVPHWKHKKGMQMEQRIALSGSLMGTLLKEIILL